MASFALTATRLDSPRFRFSTYCLRSRIRHKLVSLGRVLNTHEFHTAFFELIPDSLESQSAWDLRKSSHKSIGMYAISTFVSPHRRRKRLMNRKTAFTFAAILAVQGLPLQADDKPVIKASAEKPVVTEKTKEVQESPWIIVEEDFWFPLRFEPLETLNTARYHYRRNEEKAAAAEISKAASWLNLAAGHAMPQTKKNLEEAATQLKAVAKDLEAGNIVAAKHVDFWLTKAAHALADWHYYRAKESWGQSEAKDAGRDLVMAANYLQNAADSAHFQVGPDSETVLTQVFKNGKLESSETHTDHNWVANDLEGIENALSELGKTLEK